MKEGINASRVPRSPVLRKPVLVRGQLGAGLPGMADTWHPALQPCRPSGPSRRTLCGLRCSAFGARAGGVTQVVAAGEAESLGVPSPAAADFYEPVRGPRQRRQGEEA